MTWYVVFRGTRPGVYDNWGLCQAQVFGFSHSSYKKFNIAEQAFDAYEAFVHATGVMMDDQGACKGTTKEAEPKLINRNPWKPVIIGLVLLVAVLLITPYWLLK